MVEIISLDGKWQLINNDKSIHITTNDIKMIQKIGYLLFFQ